MELVEQPVERLGDDREDAVVLDQVEAGGDRLELLLFLGAGEQVAVDRLLRRVVRTVEVAVSTRGDSAVTVTVSCTRDGDICTLTTAVCPSSNSRLRSAVVKPASCIEMR